MEGWFRFRISKHLWSSELKSTLKAKKIALPTEQTFQFFPEVKQLFLDFQIAVDFSTTIAQNYVLISQIVCKRKGGKHLFWHFLPCANLELYILYKI